MIFPGGYSPTTEQRCEAVEVVLGFGDLLTPGEADMVVDYLAELCRKDDVALAQKTALRYMDLTGWYRVLAALHT